MSKGSKILDPTYEKAQKVIDIYQKQVAKTEKRVKNLFIKKNHIEDLIEPLSEFEQEIIKLRYFKKYRWEMVASSMHYSKRQCINISQGILNKMHVPKM